MAARRTKPQPEPKAWRHHLLVCAVLAACVLAVFSQTVRFGFVDLDDDIYVTENPNVLNGLTASSIGWAFTTTHSGNWHPLTWVSLMLDAQFSPRGLGQPPMPRGTVFHATNVALHLANTLLLYLLLATATGRRWPSAFVALLFGAHPLHVESVAWVTERKDVLSAFFWLLVMLAYVSYVRAPSRLRMALVCAVFALGLMAKPMLVSLPIVLLAFDFWPLRRIGDCRLQIADWRLEKGAGSRKLEAGG